MDGALNGVVYVSVGNIKSLTPDKQKALIDSFSQLKQNVLWDNEDLIDDLPQNILMHNSPRHSTVLAHKNIVLFVTHGDTIVVKQALYFGIPMLIIPLHNNQVNKSKT